MGTIYLIINYDAAIQYYDNLINSNKKVPEANYGKGSSSYMQGDYDSALKSLDKALSTDAVSYTHLTLPTKA